MFLYPMLTMVLFLLEGDPVDLGPLVTALSGTVTSGQIVSLMATMIGAGSVIYLTWVFGRKTIGSFYRAIRGKAPIR